MEMDEVLKLKQRYAGMPDEEIIEMLLLDKEEFRKEAYEILYAEADKRGLKELIEERRKSNKEPVDIQLNEDEIKTEKYTRLIIVNDYDDKEFLENIFDKKDVPYVVENLSMKDYDLPALFSVEESRVDESIGLLKNFKPKACLILW